MIEGQALEREGRGVGELAIWKIVSLAVCM